MRVLNCLRWMDLCPRTTFTSAGDPASLDPFPRLQVQVYSEVVWMRALKHRDLEASSTLEINIPDSFY